MIRKVIGLTLLVLVSLLMYECSQNSKLKADLDRAIVNYKVYADEYSHNKDKIRQMQLTIDELKYSADSTIHKLDSVRSLLKIKDKNLQHAQYQKSIVYKTDTISFTVPLFITDLKVDTLLKDKWYSIKLGLEYPSTINTELSFVSSKYIFVSLRKETVNPPKRFFLFRWFQRKHKVSVVDIVEENPYIENKQSRFVEIIKK